MVAAVRVHKVGGPEVLTYEDISVPAPGPGQIKIRNHACGVNFIDTYFRMGMYPSPAGLPFVSGNEGAGEVIAVGPDVTDIKVGDRVGYVSALGAYAAEQEAKQRLDDPLRHWKISESDYSERELWPQYREAYEDALTATSTKRAPWYVIPANHKWFRNLAVSQIIADTMDAMGLQLPPTRVDIAEIRRKYHAAERQTNNGAKRRKETEMIK